MGDDIGSGSVTGCRLRSLGDHRQHTVQVERKSKQTEPEPMSSPINYPAYLKLQRVTVKKQRFCCQYSLKNYLELCNQLFNSKRIVKTKIADVQNGQIRLFSSIHDPRASRCQLSSSLPCRLPLLTKDKKLRLYDIGRFKVGD